MLSLTSPQGRALIEAYIPYDPEAALALTTRLRSEPFWRLHPGTVAEAATQARLRTRASTRFPGRPRWWTADGLEQATRPALARRHAERFTAAGVTEIVDLGCGAGSDSLAFAEAGMDVTAVDRDPHALWALASTARDWGWDIETVQADLTQVPLGQACFVDPARRVGGKRRLAPETWSPPWSWVRGLADEVTHVGAKIAPGIDHALLPPDTQTEWTSAAGTLLEAAVWWGPLRVGPARRIATVAVESAAGPPETRDTVGRDGTTQRDDASWAREGDRPATRFESLDDAAGVPSPEARSMGGWLVEPGPGVIRAGLVTVLGQRMDARPIHPLIAYLTCDSRPDPGPFGRAFEVLAEMPARRKPLRAALLSAGYGDVVVKKRGVDIVPEELRAALRLPGGGPTATIVMARTDAGPSVHLVRAA